MQSQFDQWFNSLHQRDGVISKANPHASIHGGARSVVSDAQHHVNSRSESKVEYNRRGERDDGDVILSRSIADAKDQDPRTSSNSQLKYADSMTQSVDSSMSAHGKSEATPTSSADVNEDIMAFYQAKEELLKRRGGQGR